MPEIPPGAQQALIALQGAQQQMQAFAMQRQTLVLQRHEVEKAMEELEKTDGKEDVYKLSGPIMIRSTKQKLLGDLKERTEKIEASMKRIEEFEKKTADRMRENQEKLEKMFAVEGKKTQAG